MKICGPKYALCGLILSVWGVCQLLLMALFFHMKSVALIEDVGVELKKDESLEVFYKLVDSKYTSNAHNCLTAAILYLVTFFFSFHQFYVNSRSSLSV